MRTYWEASTGCGKPENGHDGNIHNISYCNAGTLIKLLDARGMQTKQAGIRI